MDRNLGFISFGQFSSNNVIRTPPVCSGRKFTNSRRPKSSQSRNKKQRRPARRIDPILDDGDQDMTDITTYVSCPVCFNSIMLRPEQLAKGPMDVTCNCCEQSTVATLERLENMDGTQFDVNAWKRELAIAAANREAEQTEQTEQTSSS